MQCFEEIALSSTQAPEVACVILDGAAIVQMLKPGMAKNFGEYAKDVFISCFLPVPICILVFMLETEVLIAPTRMYLESLAPCSRYGIERA